MKKYLILILFGLLGCSKEQMNDCFTSAGDEASRSVSFDAFKGLEVSDKISIELREDSMLWGTATIVGPENLLEQVKFSVGADSMLHIDPTYTCNFVRSFDIEMKVVLYVHRLEQIKMSSVAKVFSSDTIRGERLDILHEALSDLNLTLNYNDVVYVRSLLAATTNLQGICRSLRGSIEEKSDLDARSLICDEALIDNHSPLPCYVNGTKILFINIFNSGNVYYLTEPSGYKVLNIQRGSGELLKL